MKPRRVDLNGAKRKREVIERVLQTRLNEALNLAPALVTRERQQLHDFRIACKRLRYALERFKDGESKLERAADCLSDLQDALGEVHDRDVLLTILPPNVPETERRLLREREEFVAKAEREWDYTMYVLGGYAIWRIARSTAKAPMSLRVEPSKTNSLKMRPMTDANLKA